MQFLRISLFLALFPVYVVETAPFDPYRWMMNRARDMLPIGNGARSLPRTCLILTSTMVEITIRKRPRAEAVVTQRKFFKKTARGKVIKGTHVIRRLRVSSHANSSA